MECVLCWIQSNLSYYDVCRSRFNSGSNHALPRLAGRVVEARWMDGQLSFDMLHW